MDRKAPRGYHHQKRKIQFLFSHHHLYPHQHHPDVVVLDIPEINLKPETVTSCNLEVSLL